MRYVVILCLSLFIVISAIAKQPNPVDLPSLTAPLLEFTPNKGQWHENVRYQADMKGGRVYLEDGGITYFFYNQEDVYHIHPRVGATVPAFVRAHAVKVNFVNANTQHSMDGMDSSVSIKNYFLGNDPAHWATGLHSFRKVNYENLYNGIDLGVYSNGGDLKYDFIVSAGVSTDLIRLSYSGCDRLYIEKGKLMMSLSVGMVEELQPYAYQLVGGEKKEVACEFVLEDTMVSFRFPKGYDATHKLVIDPTLVFSSYTGSYADNWGYTATYDAAGDLIVGGNINGPGYPVTPGAYQLTYKGPAASQNSGGGNRWASDMAIAKFNPAGNDLIYATYLGGGNNEEPHSLLTDGEDNLLILGISFSVNFPVTAGSYNTKKKGSGDLVIAKLNPMGTTLLAGTYIGGNGEDGVNYSDDFFTQGVTKFSYGDECRADIICDANNDYYVTTATMSPDFPVTAGVLQPAFGGTQDAVVFKLSKDLKNLLWSTFLGGNNYDGGYSIKVDLSNNLYVAGGTASANFPTTAGTIHPTPQGGVDGFVAHISGDGSTILSSTYVGTSSYDQAFFVDLDSHGNVYLCGQTMGAYPVTPGVYNNAGSSQFLHELSQDLSSTVFSTTFGNGVSIPNISESAFLVDTCGNIYVSGWGRCLDFGFYPGNNYGMPVTADAFQKTTDGCDFYFIVFAPGADSLLYATYFGSYDPDPAHGEHVDGGTSRFSKHGTIYEAVCAGCDGRSTFPTTPGAYSAVNNSDNCNNGVIKLNFEIGKVNIAVTANATNHGCTPLTVLFNSATSDNAIARTWDFGDGSPLDTAVSPQHIYASNGTYTATFVAYSICNADTARVSVHAEANAKFSFTKSACKPEVNFVIDTVSSSVYRWQFGDGDSSSLTNPSHTYPATGDYVISLITNPDSNSCVTTQTIHYAATDATSILIPNVFSPNNDGKNDLFEIKGVEGCPFHMKVFNRWGKLLFESSDPNVSWDGKISGAAADEGVYFYALELDNQNLHGSLTLKK